MTDHDICGAPTAEDTACQHPTTDEGDPGRCWVPAHNDAADELSTTAGGRPSEFSDDRAREACYAAKQSKSKSGCARAAGVDPHTLNRWLEDNPTFENEDGDIVEFRQAFAQARRDGETVLVQGGLRNDEVDTSMAKFLLSTSFGYVKTERKEHLVDDDADLSSDRPTAEFVVVNETTDEPDD